MPTAPLPEALISTNGKRVRTPGDWRARRLELLELFQQIEYGHVPTEPATVTGEPWNEYQPPARSGSNGRDVPAEERVDYPSDTTIETLRLRVRFSGSIAPLTFPLRLTIPRSERPLPVIVRCDLCWGLVKPEIAALVARRGYVLAEFDRATIFPDDASAAPTGLRASFDRADFGALAAWAWGFLRVSDFLVTRSEIDAAQIVYTGHSRGGKAALLAGAIDPRAALVNPNNTGCGGAGCYRHQGPASETLADIVRRFPHWFHRDLPRYVGREHELPFDQHELLACVAPRGLLLTEALGDAWGNPTGTLVSHDAAAPVYAFLNTRDQLRIHYREGVHEQNLLDWQTLLDVADHQLRGAPAPRLNSRPFEV
jgi:dienelactone hydrolase